MNSRLISYLDKKGAKALDDDVMEAYATSMKERTIPDIEKEVRKNEERAAERRFSPDSASRRQKAIAGKKAKQAQGEEMAPNAAIIRN